MELTVDCHWPFRFALYLADKLVGIYSVCRVSTECKMLSGSEILPLYKAGHKHTQPYMPSR